jgi:valyl-tRNA synthetase
MMEKTFDPKAVEGRIASAWQDAGAFRAGRPERAGAEAFTIVIPPPNVTGSLHMGHALNTTLQDILCRFERMRGKDVLWQPGTDHAGIATQMVVERQLLERQEPGRLALGRDKFLERVWDWKTQSGGAIIEQLQRLGASCDWSRERFTMDDGLSRAVVKVFVELYKQGLIYKDKRLVNWDPELQTAISDLEVKQVETKGDLWYFKYPVVDDAGADTGEFIVVATTRPETMLGDTGVAVHPDDERYKHLHGRMVRLPLVGRLIPIIADEYSDPEKGTGAVKITPAHDFNDFEVGKRHHLRPINVLSKDGRILVNGPDAMLVDRTDNRAVEELQRTFDALQFPGLDRFEARKRVVEMMDALGLVDKIEPHTHMVPHGDRSGAIIEPWLTEQWYVDAKSLAQPALAAVREGQTRFIPQNWEKTYFDWLENIQPWCISRQLWWGHQIPAWYGPCYMGTDEQTAGIPVGMPVFVAASEEEACAAALEYYRRPLLPDGKPGFPNLLDVWITEHPNVSHPLPNLITGISISRDPDVLDTWFSSALWPFSTLGWPAETLELKTRYPTSVLVTGFDIIFFWVARMMMMGLHFMHEVPFRDVYIHALVRDEMGAKMSKSKGNVVDPLHLIETYGADALRFTLAAMAAQGRDIKLSTQRIEGYRNFGTKLWNAARFAEINGCTGLGAVLPPRVEITLDRWILGETEKVFREVTRAIESYRFNDAAYAAYRFVWNIFCDWYLELVKPLLRGDDGAAKEEARRTTGFVLDQVLKLLHPFMPFLTEELWAITASADHPRASLLALAAWPTKSELDSISNCAVAGLVAKDASYEDAFAALVRPRAEIGFIIDLVSEIRSVRAEMNVPAAAQIPLVLVNAYPEAKSHAEDWDETIKRLARLSEISFAPEAPEKSVQMVMHKTIAALPLQGIIDFEAEKTRLAKEIAKLKGDVDKIEAKLRNADFVARAPEEVVDENRERREDALSRMEKLAAALARLGGA